MHYVAEPASFEWTEGSDVRGGRPHRLTHKDRGSLLFQMGRDAAVPRHMKPGAAQKQIKAKKKSVVAKRISPDVYIPSTVSVGSLARLLGVRLGRDMVPWSITSLTF
jgi:translation initiation factor IF-2